MNRFFEKLFSMTNKNRRGRAFLASALAILYIFAAGCAIGTNINSDLHDAPSVEEQAGEENAPQSGVDADAEKPPADPEGEKPEDEKHENSEQDKPSDLSETDSSDPDTDDSASSGEEAPTIDKSETPPDEEEEADPVEDEGGEEPPESDLGETGEQVNSTFSIHFIDVGQADAALVECDGHYMLIDGGNRDDSNLIYSVLSRNSVSALDIVVATHAHEDHIGGIPGAFNYATAKLTLCPVTDYDSETFRNFKRYAEQKGGGITIPTVGDTYTLGSAVVTILGVNGGSDTNDTSIVLKIRYGEMTFLFTGDAEREAEQAIINSGADLSSTVLKVGHHGSDTSTSYLFLRGVMPKYAVISVGTGNTYGHPTEEVLSRLRDADVAVYRTDLQGDIFCVSDGKSVSFTVTRNADADTLVPAVGNNTGSNETQDPDESDEPAEDDSESTAEIHEYIGNRNTKKFHHPSCRHVKSMKEENKLYYTGTREGILEMGYSPCGTCNP